MTALSIFPANGDNAGESTDTKTHDLIALSLDE